MPSHRVFVGSCNIRSLHDLLKSGGENFVECRLCGADVTFFWMELGPLGFDVGWFVQRTAVPIPSIGRLYIYLYEWLIFQLNIGKYIPYMDAMGSGSLVITNKF